MYHGYPDESIPLYCSFKIGIHAVIPNVEAQFHNQKQHDAVTAAAAREEVLDEAQHIADTIPDFNRMDFMMQLRSEVKKR